MLGSWPSCSGFSCSPFAFAWSAPAYSGILKAVWSMAIPSRETELPLWEEGAVVPPWGGGWASLLGRSASPSPGQCEVTKCENLTNQVCKGRGIDAKFLRQLDFYIRQLNFYFGQSL